MSKIENMFEAGLHYGYSKTRRHPSASSFIYTTKNKVDIIDLEKTEADLDSACSFLSAMSAQGKTVLWVGVKPEAKKAINDAGMILSMPYVTERWVGGSLTNWTEVRKRIARLIDLKNQKETGELALKYTKKERLMIDREVAKMEKNFSGLVGMTKLPDVAVVIDPKREHIAVTELQKVNIPVIALGNTDCDMAKINYPIIGNDGSVSSIKFIVEELVKAYRGKE